MENKHSSDGIAEDMIRAFVQVGCAESHAKTIMEKTSAELDNGLVDVEDADAVQRTVDKLTEITEEIGLLANLRRDIMLQLFEMYDGDKDYWCMVKHLGVGAYTIFEAYQASDDDPELLLMSMEANRRFIKALSRFLGTEITDCAACFHDMLKGGHSSAEEKE